MLANLLYLIWPYQIFKSVFFRGGMAFLTTYFIIVVGMPPLIRMLRQKGFSGDFGENGQANRPYAGGKPIMGGGLLIAGIVAAAAMWMEWNQFLVALVMILLAFAAIGAWDDIAKIRHRRRVEQGTAQKASYSDKADGASGWIRLGAEIGVAFLVVAVLYRFIT
ncbi:MAG TPA: phospho-N-acetylmuramoyl-pentapeptide-transferase, partial [bacterium]